MWEYGFDEAWTKHVLYHRAVAEGMLYSVVPVRNSEAELPIDLLRHLGGVVDESDDALRCSNAWFLDGVQNARFPGNAIVETDSHGRCSAFNAAVFVAPCRQYTPRNEEANTNLWAGSHHQRWEVTSRGCIVPVLVGEEANECITVPLPSDRVSRRLLYDGCDKLCFESGSGSEGESSDHLDRQSFQLYQDGKHIPWSEVRGTQWRGELRTANFDAAGRSACVTADYYSTQGRAAATAASPLSLQPCSSVVEQDETQRWQYDSFHKRLEIRFAGAGANGGTRHTCLAFPSCGVRPIDMRELRVSCNARTYSKSEAFDAVSEGPASQRAPAKRWTNDIGQAKAATDILSPQPGSHDVGEENNAQAAADALRKWFEITGVRSKQLAAAMSFHDVRSTFFNVVTVSSAAGLLLPWSEDAQSWFSFAPVQLMVALLRRVELQRAYCIAEVASLLIEREPNATRGLLGTKITGWFQRPIKATTLFFRRAAIEVMVTHLSAAQRASKEDELGGLPLPAFVAAVQDFYDNTERDVPVPISFHSRPVSSRLLRGKATTERTAAQVARWTTDEEDAAAARRVTAPAVRAERRRTKEEHGSERVVLICLGAFASALLLLKVVTAREKQKHPNAAQHNMNAAAASGNTSSNLLLLSSKGENNKRDVKRRSRRSRTSLRARRGGRKGKQKKSRKTRDDDDGTANVTLPSPDAASHRSSTPTIVTLKVSLAICGWLSALMLVGTFAYTSMLLITHNEDVSAATAYSPAGSSSALGGHGNGDSNDWLSGDDGVEEDYDGEGEEEETEEGGDGANRGATHIGFINPGVMSTSVNGSEQLRYVRYTGCINGNIREQVRTVPSSPAS